MQPCVYVDEAQALLHPGGAIGKVPIVGLLWHVAVLLHEAVHAGVADSTAVAKSATIVALQVLTAPLPSNHIG